MPIAVICIVILLIISIDIIRYLSEVKLWLLGLDRPAQAPARRERAKQHTGLNCARPPEHYTLRHATLTRGKRAPSCKDPQETRDNGTAARPAALRRRRAHGNCTPGKRHVTANTLKVTLLPSTTAGPKRQPRPNARNLRDRTTPERHNARPARLELTLSACQATSGH
eukprot:UN2284